MFVAALTQSDCGLQAILDNNTVGHCLSAFVDSKCRFVANFLDNCTVKTYQTDSL